MDEKDDESHYPPEPAETKEVVRCGYMNPCEIQTFLIAGCEAFIYIRRRRRWKEKGGRESFFNTYKYTIEGIKCTPKFGAFLKKLLEGKPISIGNIAYVLGTDAKRLNRWSKDYLSSFREAERDGRIGKDDIEVRREGGQKRSGCRSSRSQT